MKKYSNVPMLAVVTLLMIVSCRQQSTVVAPIESLNLDSLKTYVDKAAMTGNSQEQYYAANYYLNQYTESDSTRAIELLIKSASKDFPFAANLLGEIYSEDSTSSRYDVNKAIEYFELGVRNGSDKAMSNLANLLIDGHGVNPDYERAMKLRSNAILGLLKLAKIGDAAAQWRLGVMLTDGIGCPRNRKAGFEWIKKSADQGYLQALYSLGTCYSNGYGVDIDEKEAFRYYEKAAENGHPAQLMQQENAINQETVLK